MMSATSCGRDMNGAWLDGTDRTVAIIRLARNSCAGIENRFVRTAVHVGPNEDIDAVKVAIDTLLESRGLNEAVAAKDRDWVFQRPHIDRRPSGYQCAFPAVRPATCTSLGA